MKKDFYTIINIYSPLLTYVLNLEKFPENFENFEKTKDTIYTKFQIITEKLKSDKYKLEDIIIPIIAYIDEKILLSEWKHRNQWLPNMLQKSYFKTQEQGINFYERFESFNEEQVLEKLIYIYILNLGFVGKNYINDEYSFKNFKKEQKEFFNQYIENYADDRFFEYSYAKDIKREKKSSIWNKLIFFPLLLLLLILLILMFKSRLDHNVVKIDTSEIKQVDMFDKELREVFVSSNIEYKSIYRTALIPLQFESFTRDGLNEQDEFRYKIDTVYDKFFKFIMKYKNEIKDINLNSYTSSEYRSEKESESQFNKNKALAKSRALKLKNYLIEKSKGYDLDLQNFINNKIHTIDKGSINFITDEYGKEIREKTRRIEVEVIRANKGVNQ